MALSYVVIPPEVLGKLTFVKHLESIGDTVNRGRTRVRIAKEEVYKVMNGQFGSLTVKVPSKGALKGDFHEKEVRLINPRVVNRPVPYFNETTQTESARPRLFLEADKIELVSGGQK
ncbi:MULTISPECIES: hypothetical protein [Enterococcus]|uniref:Uncharacterized protein n=2 Tax=Enterococcus faecalis TaxID=1351 RepID=A0ABC9P641_ENTFL|nr:hypothetical protein [Enterococcus faecalis]MDU7687726.1 hypothetical protein [Bacillota bacterium]EEN73055.1 hypothetical protein HMPREF0345_0012 [Enterococcus faecalis ATCC 29200]EEU70475.1 predicted protein [Enterococcus faecalis HIP11704]EFM77907.1 hypothetical protein HMPREF9521_00127 [Enterococcus faecalis TX2134]EFU90287.1 hypothetical protein HMPREF9511_01716 [Enterococcus faecalis TX0630]